MSPSYQIFSVIFLLTFINAYKLNVPKVLLPYHSTKLITFTLEAMTDSSEPTDDLCFVWSSSRPDIVTITPIYDSNSRPKVDRDGSFLNDANECSSKAIVSAVSKHAQRYTSIILAKETKTDKLIRCDVIVDQISKIRIKHTTTHLYLEDSPESFTVEALDDEGNTFSSIDGLPFEYNIINDHVTEDSQFSSNMTSDSIDSRDILRLSKFIESEYAVSDSIRQLELIGLSGHKILIEGLKTGMANVQAKLIDSSYKETLKTPLVRLLVVANILLEPSYAVYLLPGSTVKYNVFLIKQTSIEKITLPSLQYYFETRNTSAADLLATDSTGSTIIGRSIGSTEVVLTDRNMKEDIYTILPPPTALVHIVQPDHLVFSIKNWRSSWILEVGRTYEIMIHVYSQKKQQIFPSDNLNIQAIFEKLNLQLDYSSRNGSYHIVTGLMKGITQAKASLIGTLSSTDQPENFDFIARGEQDIELLDPINLVPKQLIFARQVTLPTDFYTTKSFYEVKLSATGGSGTYYWQTLNSTIANVNSYGLIRTTATQVGQTSVTVTDTRNIDIHSKAMIYVLDAIDLQIHSCPVETELGTRLYLNVRMHALIDTGKKVLINDCSRLQFEVNINDESVFRLVTIQSPFSDDLPSQAGRFKDTSCAIIVLDALSVGRTSIKLSTITTVNNSNKSSTSLIQLNSNDLQIGSYSYLKSHKKNLVLAPGSSVRVHLFDGPLLSSLSNQLSPGNSFDSNQASMYATRATVTDTSLLRVTPIEDEFEPNKYSYLVECLQIGDAFKQSSATTSNSRFAIWHKSSASNTCPVEFEYEIQVSCTHPHSIHLSQFLVNNEDSEESGESMLNKLKWKCPIKAGSRQAIAHFSRPLLVEVKVKDVMGNLFDNFTSAKTGLEWNLENKKLLEKSKTDLSWLEMSVDEIEKGIVLSRGAEATESQKVYYQVFETKAKFGDAKLSVRMNKLTSELNVQFVDDVRVSPEALTVFNHPSNVVSLVLANGSGYYHSEIETIRSALIDHQQQVKPSTSALKINQISSTSVVVSPLVNNGLAYIHVYDYCVPPSVLPQRILSLSSSDVQVLHWPASTSSKIQVAGINSIVATYEDDKCQVQNQLKIYVQISDATGNLIRTSYFSLMSLTAKLTINSDPATIADSFSTIVPASPADYEDAQIKEEDKPYTAMFLLNAHRTGFVNVQFEARSDGYIMETTNIKSGQTIRSQLKEVQIYAPLNVQPKYVELAEGSVYQVTTTGGPILTDAAIYYQIIKNEYEEGESSSVGKESRPKIIEVNDGGIVNAVSVGLVRMMAKSVSTNKKQKVYSEDEFVVRVVKVHSVQILVALKSIKVGNEMPVFLMANERKLTPLNFATSPYLRYSWKLNDKQIASLSHPTEDSSATKHSSSFDETDYSRFDSSFSLRFQALKPGTVKISVKIEITDPKTGQQTFFKDSIEVTVFESLEYFTHLKPSYYAYKYPKQFQIKNLRSQNSPAINEYSILMTPGSQFQVKTNLGKSTLLKSNINYRLSFFNNENIDFSSARFCDNQTVHVSEDGVVTAKHLDHHQLKKAKQCIVNLLVYVDEQSTDQVADTATSSKQQTLTYTIKVKPVFYSMIHLKKYATMPGTTITTTASTFPNNIQIKFHMSFHDDLGDMFDVINSASRYSLSRNDLAEFSQMNKNLFVTSDETEGQSIDKSDTTDKLEAFRSVSVLANAPDNSFVVRTLKPGKFIMEMRPTSAYNQIESRDFFSLMVDDKSGMNVGESRQLETRIGDVFCLMDNDFTTWDLSMDFDEVDSSKASSYKNTDWHTDPDGVVKLLPVNSQTSVIFGLCSNEGNTQLKHNDHLSIKISVRPAETVKFLSTSVKYATNVPNVNTLNPNLNNGQKTATSLLTPMSNLVQFQTVNSFYSHNCSSSFEKYFHELNNNEDSVPFTCSASFFATGSNRELTYLNQLITTKMLFVNRHWTCDVRFTADSNIRLYELINTNQEQIVDDQNKITLVDNEPAFIRLTVDTKQNQDNSMSEVHSRGFVHDIPFIPAFHVHTKQIQLPINRNSYYIQNLKSKNLKEYSLNEHFNLILYSTRALQSHLIVTTNCPSLIKIKPMTVSRVAAKLNGQQNAEVSGSVLGITYDITTSSDLFDLNTYANLLQDQNGHLYVQITCTLTQQIERIPIKFLFGMSDGSGGFKPVVSNLVDFEESEPWYLAPFSWLPDLNANQIVSYLFMLVITLITFLAFLKFKSPTRSPIDQITLNASTAAAAAAAAAAAHQTIQRQSPNLKDTSSFNPYRYFSPSAEPDFARNSPRNVYGESMIISPQRFNKFVPYERSQLRLFSVRDAGNASYTSFDHNSSGRFNPDDDNFNQSY